MTGLTAFFEIAAHFGAGGFGGTVGGGEGGVGDVA
jgi:hypothetical protein